jgi:hypothetical protein
VPPTQSSAGAKVSELPLGWWLWLARNGGHACAGLA